MRLSLTLGLAILLPACGGNNLYGVDPNTGSDTGVATDTGTTTDTSPADTADTQPAAACHAADPLDQTGYTRTYNVIWQGKTGTETQSGLGADTTYDGTPAFVVKSDLQVDNGGDQLTTYDYRGCDGNGGAVWYESRIEGTASFSSLFGGGSDTGGGNIFQQIAQLIQLFNQLTGNSTDTGGGSASMSGLPVHYQKIPDSPVPYLGDLASMSAGALVRYDYSLMQVGQTANFFNVPNCSSGGGTGGLDATCVPISGSVNYLGLQSVTVPAGTFQAYEVYDEHTEEWSQAQANGGLPGGLGSAFPMPGFGQTQDIDLISVKYYVPGIGLVKEQTKYADAAADDWLIQRELASTTLHADN